MKTNESLPLKNYKAKRKNALMDCLYAIIAAILMMLPVVAVVYGTLISYDDDNSASAFIVFVFLVIAIFVTGVIFRLVYQQFAQSINAIILARDEFIKTEDETDVVAFRKRKRKQKIWLVSIVTLVFVIMIAFNIATTTKIDSIYKSAEELISQCDYEEALELLEGIAETKHKDTLSLITLCKCYIDYEKGRGVDAYYDLQEIDFHWQNSSQLSKISELKVLLQKEHDEYIKRMAENAQKNYEEKKRIEEAEKKSKSKSKSTYIPKYKEDKSDPYNAKDYRNEEDFYDDHYYDFFDYYDAEQYYRDHHD